MCTIKEAEGLTGLSDKTIRRYIQQGKIQATQGGRQYHIDVSSLQPYLKKHTQSDVYSPTPPGSSLQAIEEELSVQELLQTIQGTATALSANNTQIFESFKDLVKPIVDTTVNKQPEIAELQKMLYDFTQTFANNAAAVMSKYAPTDLSPEELFNNLTRGLEVPRELRDISIRNTEEVLDIMHRNGLPTIESK